MRKSFLTFIGQEKIKNIYSVSIILILALAFLLPGAYGVLFRSGFFWGVSHFTNQLGGLQCLAVMATGILIVFVKPKKWFTVCMCCAALIVVFSGVPMPVLIGWIYWECVFLVGSACLPGKEKLPISYEILTGISVIGAAMMIMSFLGKGTIVWLRGGFLVVTVVSFFTILLSKKKYQPLAIRLWRFSQKNQNKATAILMVIITVFLAMLFAKSAMAYDYDSQWYSFRSSQVLVGDHSIFDNLQMSAFVYFYPKLEEFLYLPLSGIGEYAFLICANIIILPILGCTLYQLLKYWAPRLSTASRLLIIVAILSIPSIANIATTAKSDIMGCYFCIVAIQSFLDYYYRAKKEGLFFTILALGLCTGTKATFLLWGGIIFLVVMISLIQQRLYSKIAILNFTGENKWNYWGVCLSWLLLMFGIHFRTLLLTGYPTYPVLVNLYNGFGLKPKNGALVTWSMNDITGWKKQISQIINAMFFPQDIGNLVIQWFSTIWVFLLLLAIIRFFLEHRRICIQRIFMPLLIALFVIVTFVQVGRVNSLDGNYFNVPILIISLYSASRLLQGNKNSFEVGIKSAIKLFLSLQLILCYFTHPSWGSGITAMSLQTAVEWNKTQTYVNVVCESNNLMQIKGFVDANLEGKRVLVGNNDIWYYLPWRSEKICEVQSTYFSNRHWDGTYVNGKKYMEATGTCAIAVMKDDTSGLLDFAQQYASEVGVKKVVQTKTAFLFYY